MITTLPNGLVTYKMMFYKPTKEKCQIIKVNPEETNVLNQIVNPMTVDIKIDRTIMGIQTSEIFKEVNYHDLETWNESMRILKEIRYKRRGKVVNFIWN